MEKGWFGISLYDHISNFTKEAIFWNKNSFGNIFRKKRWTLARISGIQKSQDKIFSHNMQILEKDLILEYNNILQQEEIHWFQKSRAKWITLGERNTRYFHLTTIIRRRKGKISMLRDDSNNWVEDPDSIKSMVQTYFINLFKENPSSNGSYHVFA